MDTDLDGVRVRCVLGQNYRSTFQGVGTSPSAHDVSRKGGHRLRRSEGDLVENSSLGSIR